MKGSENETDEFPFYDHHYKESQEIVNSGISQRSSIPVSNQDCVEKFEDKSSSPHKDIKNIEDIQCDEETAQETTHPDLENSDSEENSSSKRQNLEIGDLNCFCSPTRVDGRKDFLNRICLWCYLNKDQFMSALTVCVTQIPEAIASAIIVGVNPARALQGTWIMNIITSLVGGSRPGMICGTTTFVAIALSELKEDEGSGYIFYAIMFGACLQLLFGALGMGIIVRFFPYPVIQGFANAMGIVIIAAQFAFGKISGEITQQRNLIDIGYSWEHITDENTSWRKGSPLFIMISYAVVSFLISLFLQRITRVVPGALVALVISSIVEQTLRKYSNYESATIEDYAKVETPYLQPIWIDNDIDMPGLTLETLKKVYLTGIAVFCAGISESLLTLQIIDNLTEYKGNQNRVVFGQGIANMLSAMAGGLGGGGSVGQAVVSIHCGGITRISTFLSGCFMIISIYYAYDIINLVPLGAVAGVMLWSAVMLIDWTSIKSIIAATVPLSIRDRLHMDFKINRGDVLVVIVMMGTTACIDLTYALVAGVLFSILIYAWDSSNRVSVERKTSIDETLAEETYHNPLREKEVTKVVTYHVSGPLFFATSQTFVDAFQLEEIQFDPKKVIINLEGAEIFDSSGMIAVKRICDRFEFLEKNVGISFLSETSRRLMEKNAYMWQDVQFYEEEKATDDNSE